MSLSVARAIDEGKHLMVEAGTGVGKSFAYLVPAILAAAEQGKKVVVSTHTISLQEQLLDKDLPFLRAVMPVEFTAVLVKGRGNYISLRRLEAATGRAARHVSDDGGIGSDRRVENVGRPDDRRQQVGLGISTGADGLGRGGQRKRQLPRSEMSPI